MPTMACRWVYLRQADKAAIDDCLADWRAAGPLAGALAMVAERSSTAVPGLQQAFVADELPLIGAVYPELIVDGQFQTEGVLLFGFTDMPPYLLLDGLEPSETASRVGIEGLAGFVDSHANPNGGDTGLIP